MTRYFRNKIVPALANVTTFSFLCKNDGVLKKCNAMKYRLLFVFLLVLPMLFSAGATAQSVVVSNLGLKDTAIVRPFGEEYALTYSDNAFVLCNRHDNTALAFNVPFIVMDVELWNDETAYFCGEYGGYGVMGCFDILPTFLIRVCLWRIHFMWVLVVLVQLLVIIRSIGPFPGLLLRGPTTPMGPHVKTRA